MTTSGTTNSRARSRLPQMPSLDGVRALALIAVLLFHSRFTWAKGGFLGVSTFFVLSGFLITGLMLRERDTTGTIRLRSFWERRARRLAPALVLLLVLVAAYVAFGATRLPGGLIGDAIASSTWVANWRFVFAQHSYGAMFAAPSPFEHMWSLAVEEQVYLILPIAVLLLLGRGAATPRRGRLAIGLAAVAIGSTIAAALLHHGGRPPLHEYYGTDARAAEPVVGALLALLLVRPGGMVRLGPRARTALDGAAVLAIGGLLAIFGLMTQRTDFLYRGGFLLTALLSAVVIAAATQPVGFVRTLLAADPMVALGRVSYGAYLFHWPLFLWLTPARTGLGAPALFALRCVTTIGLAVLSHWLIESPIRAGRIPIRLAVPAWANASTGMVGVIALLVMTTSAPLPTLFAGPAKVPPPPPLPPPVAAPTTTIASLAAPTTVAPAKLKLSAAQAPTTTRPAPGANRLETGPPATAAPPPTPPPATGPPPLRVAVIGDSMAEVLSKGLKAWGDARGDVVTYNVATSGCPLSRGGTRRLPNGDEWRIEAPCKWWDDQYSERSKNLAAFQPDIIVMQDAMNELADRKLSSWASYRHTGEPQFDQWLFTEYKALITAVAPKSTKVLALNAVCVDWVTLGGGFEGYARNRDGDNRVASLGRTTDALASAGAQVVDFQSHICPNGRFTQTVDGVTNARPDGYHLTDAASRAVADKWLGPIVLTAGKSGSAQP